MGATMKTLAALCISLFLATLLFGLSSFAMAAYWSAAAPTLKSDAPDLVVKVDKKKKNKNKKWKDKLKDIITQPEDAGNDAAQPDDVGNKAAAPDDAGDAGAQPGAAPNNAATGSGNKCEGEHSCPAGMVVLDTPNKYGACCEAKEGVCAKGLIGTPPNCTCPEGTLSIGTADQPCVAKMNCPFPGMVGNPPDCFCPEGTEFVGNKGCKKVTIKRDCESIVGNPINDKLQAYAVNCQKKGGKWEGPGQTVELDPGETPVIPVCCVIKYYEK
jgi:hypothetical protein